MCSCSPRAALAEGPTQYSLPHHLEPGLPGLQVGKGRLYTPCAEDVGTVLKCEVVAIDSASAFGELGKTFSVSTARVRPAPSPPKRSLTPVPPPKNVVTTGKFTALTYNLLADLYATVRRACSGCLACRHCGSSWGARCRPALCQVSAEKLTNCSPCCCAPVQLG